MTIFTLRELSSVSSRNVRDNLQICFARAELVAQRIQHALRQPRAVSSLPRYTLSIGIACQSGHGEELDSLLLRSDQALYRAKQLGRDRIEIADGTTASCTLSPPMSLCS